jgi:hypothetical protein
MSEFNMQVPDEVVRELFNAFPGAFIYYNGEIIVHKAANSYFLLKDCTSRLDVQCKVLEWLSRDAYKSEPFNSAAKNLRFNKFILNGINTFLGTSFSYDDMEEIYTYLGNRCNHKRTLRFIESNYTLDLKEDYERGKAEQNG